MAASRPLLDDEGQPSSGSPLRVGDVVCGKYRIERQIGRGGMGIVLAATHLQLEHLVAIKVMRRDLVGDDRALDRLLLEARSAARIRSEHVARVLDVGTLESGSPFIVMEYLEGENLADLLDRDGALDIQQSAAFLLQCCLALSEVHATEMVHRDLKPGNVFIARLPDGSPTVKIVDFGISKQIGASTREHAATTSPQVLGSPYYMSPEQMRADAVDERSDIWSLGAILFEMLAGRPPFLGDTLPEVYSAVLNEPPPPLESLRPGVPPGLEDVVLRCLEKDPAQRFCDVADLAEALAPFAGAGAVQLVERVTRILTHPDPLRLRPSLAPGAELRVSTPPVARAFVPSQLEPGFGSGREGIMGHVEGDGRKGAWPGDEAARRVRLESGSDLERDVWRASKPPVAPVEPSADLAALSATGIHLGRRSRSNAARVWWWAGAVLVVASGVGLWLRVAPREAEQVVPARPAAGEQTPGAAREPRVAPLSPASSAAPSELDEAAHALRPLPPAEAPASGAAGSDVSSADARQRAALPRDPTPRMRAVDPAASLAPGAGEPMRGARPSERRAPERRASPAPDEHRTPAAPVRDGSGARVERPASEPASDPWDPASFGDRR